MPIDANIPLAVKPVQIDSPVKTMTDLYALQHQQALTEGQRLDNTQRQQENAKRTQDAAEAAATQSALKNAVRPDGSLDVTSAIQELHRTGHGKAGMALTDEWGKHLKVQADTAEAQIKKHMADAEMGSRIVSGATDDASWQAAKAMLLNTPDLAPESAATLKNTPDDYASAKPFIDALQRQGTSMQEQLKSHAESVKEHRDAVVKGLLKPDVSSGEQEPPALTKQREEAKQLATSSLGRMLMHTTNDQQYQQILQGAKGTYPIEVINQFAPMWSAKAVKDAEAATMTSAQAGGLDVRRREAAVAEAREKREASAPGKDDPTFTHDMEEYRTALSVYNRTQPREGDFDTNAPAGQETQHYKAPISIEDWRKGGKGPLVPAKPKSVAPDLAQGRGAPPISLAPPQPPPAATAPPAAPVPTVPTPQLPTTPPAAPAAPAAAGGQGFILTVNQAGKPPRHFKFKSEADRDKFAKDAGLQLQPAK